MNVKNERKRRMNGQLMKQEVQRIGEKEVRAAMKRMKSGKEAGPDDIPVEVLRCSAKREVEFLTRLFNTILESDMIPEEWKRRVLTVIFKNKDVVQSCSKKQITVSLCM